KKRVLEVTGKSGANVVMETVGGSFLTTAVHVLGKRGLVAVVGVLAGVEGMIPIPSLMFKEAVIQGVVVSDYTPQEVQSAWQGIVEPLQRAGQRPIIDATYPLDRFAEAFARLNSSPFGKVVVQCGT